MANLLGETVSIINAYGYDPSHVAWVGTDDFYFTWDEFAKLADQEYDDGFGSAKVPANLMVVGKEGWYLDRTEYDGSEQWSMNETPMKPDRHHVPADVVGDYWPTFDELDDPDNTFNKKDAGR